MESLGFNWRFLWRIFSNLSLFSNSDFFRSSIFLGSIFFLATISLRTWASALKSMDWGLAFCSMVSMGSFSASLMLRWMSSWGVDLFFRAAKMLYSSSSSWINLCQAALNLLRTPPVGSLALSLSLVRGRGDFFSSSFLDSGLLTSCKSWLILATGWVLPVGWGLGSLTFLGPMNFGLSSPWSREWSVRSVFIFSSTCWIKSTKSLVDCMVSSIDLGPSRGFCFSISSSLRGG